MISELIRIGVEPEFAYRYGDWLQLAAERWAIDTPLRRAAWLAQLAHESYEFRIVEESLHYTTPARLIAVWPSRFRLPVSDGEARADRFLDGKRNPRFYLKAPEALAEFVYGGRMGNGPEGSGDGFDHYKVAAARYLANSSDVYVFGILIRDVAPHQDDLRVRVQKLGTGCPSGTVVELFAIYLPGGSIQQLPAKVLAAREQGGSA